MIEGERKGEKKGTGRGWGKLETGEEEEKER